MTSVLLIITTLLFLSVHQLEAQCPAKCSCTADSRVLDCSGQKLKNLPDGHYNKFITSLDLSRNDIPILKSDVFADRDIYTLTTLIIANSLALSDIEVNAFRGLIWLKHLDLSGNDIAAFEPAVFETFLGLETLILDRNPLILPENSLQLNSLIRLSMIECRLTKIPKMFFGNMSSLTSLNLTNNELKSFDSDIVSALTVLVKLDISRNKLTSPLEVIYNLPASVQELETAKNEWACDCDLKSINSSYGKRINEQEFRCSSPPEFQNMIVTADVIRRIECVKTTEEVIVTTEGHLDDEVDFIEGTDSEDNEQVDEPDVQRDEAPRKKEQYQVPSVVDKASGAPPRKDQDVVADASSRKDQDVVVGAGVAGLGDVGSGGVNWATNNQWWLVGSAAFAFMLLVIFILQMQVRRFGRRQNSHEVDPEMEPL